MSRPSVEEIKTALKNQQAAVDRKTMLAAISRGACVISIPGMDDACQNGMFQQTCEDVAMQWSDLGANWHFFPGATCAKY